MGRQTVSPQLRERQQRVRRFLDELSRRTPRELTRDEIEELVKSIRTCASDVAV